MNNRDAADLVELDCSQSIWENCFTVFPLVVVGTHEADGSDDLAPKHMAIPLSWKNHYGFVCSPSHNTYTNVRRDGVFAVTYMRPTQTVLASLAATPRCEDGSKPITQALPTIAAKKIKAPLVADGNLFLEIELVDIRDDLDDNSLIIGRIVAARVATDSLRDHERDDEDLVYNTPLLAYLYPGRFAEIRASNKMPFPAGFKR